MAAITSRLEKLERTMGFNHGTVGPHRDYVRSLAELMDDETPLAPGETEALVMESWRSGEIPRSHEECLDFLENTD